MDSLNASQLVSSNPKTPASLSRLYARPGFLLRRAHQISAAVFEDECRDLALTPAQFGVLTVLRSHPGLGQSSLARALGFDKVTVLRVLRGLETRGFVARAPGRGQQAQRLGRADGRGHGGVDAGTEAGREGLQAPAGPAGQVPASPIDRAAATADRRTRRRRTSGVRAAQPEVRLSLSLGQLRIADQVRMTAGDNFRNWAFQFPTWPVPRRRSRGHRPTAPPAPSAPSSRTAPASSGSPSGTRRP